MNFKQTVGNYHDLHVIVKTRADEKLIQHLKKTILGTPGGLRYKHTDQEKKLEYIGESYFMILYKMSRMLGSVGFCLRETYKDSVPEKSWYIRYFAIHSPLRAQKGKQLKDKTKADRGDGILKSLALPYFSNPDILQYPTTGSVSKSIIFSYIDKENPRSLEFSEQMGFVPLRTFETIIYSRFTPRQINCVKRITDEEKPFVLSELRSFYKDYTLYSNRNIFYNNSYYLAYENSEIVAGLQANHEIWQIVEMGGVSGKLLVNFLPRIPGFRKFLNPERFEFLALEGIWYKEGKAQYIADIIETVLSLKKIHVALTWQDIGSHISTDLMKAGNFGFLKYFIKAGKGEIYIKFISFDEKEKEEYFNKPAYLSAFDMT